MLLGARTRLAGSSKGRGIFGCQEKKADIVLCLLLVLIFSTGQIVGMPESQYSGLLVSAAATSSSPSHEFTALGRIAGTRFLMNLVPILHFPENFTTLLFQQQQKRVLA